VWHAWSTKNPKEQKPAGCGREPEKEGRKWPRTWGEGGGGETPGRQGPWTLKKGKNAPLGAKASGTENGLKG